MKRLLIFSAIIFVWLTALNSCTSNSSISGEWYVVAYADPYGATVEATAVPSDEKYTLHFHDNDFFSFTTDCNTISGEFDISGKRIDFRNLSATEMACDKEIVERSVKSQLPQVKAYDIINDSILNLYGKHGNVLFQLMRVNNKECSTSTEDDCPFPGQSDAERKPKFIFKITSDSLLTCHNKFNDKEDNPLILDISNPGFNDYLAEWFDSLDSIQANELQSTYALHIIVAQDVAPATVDRVKTAIRNCGIEKISSSNFDIDE